MRQRKREEKEEWGMRLWVEWEMPAAGSPFEQLVLAGGALGESFRSFRS